MITDQNILVQVQTYGKSALALLSNSNAYIGTANYKYQGMDMPNQLGKTFLIQLPINGTSTEGLSAKFSEVEERLQPLTIDKTRQAAYAFSQQQFVLNAREWVSTYAAPHIKDIASHVEADLASLAETNTYNFVGDGVTPLDSHGQLASYLARHRNAGMANQGTKVYIDDLSVDKIVDNGLGSFVPMRNDREAFSWEVGEYKNAKFYQSNLLPIHTSGTEGVSASTLTVVSTTTDANGAVTGITFSGTASPNDLDSIKRYDKFAFDFGVTGFNDMFRLTRFGSQISQSPVQFRAEADAASNGANEVTVSIFPALQAGSGANQNISTSIVPGMEVSVLPTHRCGSIISGDALFFCSKQLPDDSPFATYNDIDPDTGLTLKTTYAPRQFENFLGFQHSLLYGRTLIDEYSTMVALPPLTV